ncbi:acetoacetyl-CoA synthetase [Gordonia effusa NBRC 100432]|uniref:Acetoacetyl-CoA synthetase n=2 Tax=Gordonia effusa TaxID=263908 RepID=H0QZC0_9ACTN|nr:acetoacetate--CoA ligase [Gordonia effusa]GAB18171.1 acetoacetyl-CoA synthetase [Gordonia effusa NBRC 100432]
MERFAELASERTGRRLDGYDALWRWSIEDLAGFWRAVWDFYGLDDHATVPLGPAASDVLADSTMPGAQWFPKIRLNYVDQVVAHAGLAGAAIVGLDESGARTEIGWAELPNRIAEVAQELRRAGVGVGDVVCAYLPDIPEAVVAFFATASIGAIFSGCGADYAPEGAAGRMAQLSPKVLFTADGYRYNGKQIEKSADNAALADLLGTVTLVVNVGAEYGDWRVPVVSYAALAQTHRGASLVTEKVEFAHPLWVLFSSGTTGKPKGIVHGHGGVVVEHLKAAGLHGDLTSGDVFFWQTALSWMMWNFQVAGLLCGARIVTYSGSPLYPDADRMWSLVADEGVTYFGTSPGQLQASRKAGLRPGTDHDLSALRCLGSTGSTLAADLFGWVDENVKSGLPVSSISGGTDVVSAFAGGSTGIPVVAGELSVRYLGVALDSWAPDTSSLRGEVGEMVITEPMPSMPIYFWNDDDGTRYRDAYFAHEWPGAGSGASGPNVASAGSGASGPNVSGAGSGASAPSNSVWRHGDWVTVTERGSLIIHGRSDATLNRHGIRMGSADIYEVVEGLDEIAEAFVLGVDGPDSKYWMPLFVTLVPGARLDDSLTSKIASTIAARLSRRHVPDEVLVAPGIPHTKTGKKLEVPVTAILAGRDNVSIDPRAVDDYPLVEWFAQVGAAHKW